MYHNNLKQLKMSELTKLQPITILPSVLKIGRKNANKKFGGKRNFSKYVTYLIKKDDEQ